MRSKQIFLLSLFFILIGSLIYYALPRVVYPPLRKDSIPSGAYVIPWMRPSPSIEELVHVPINSPPWDIDAVMAGALKLDLTFNIAIPNGSRIVPSTVYLGHDTDLLYIGGKFQGMYTNPASNPLDEIMPNYFEIFFDVADDGVLKSPESGSRLSVFLAPDAGWHTGKMWGYHDMAWFYVRENEREHWVLADNYYEWILRKAQPAFAIENVVLEYDNSTGNLMTLFSRYLSRTGNSEVNALQMRTGERWVMGFLLELGYATHYSSFGNFVDGWPRKTYPYLDNDASWWPKLVIDLSNPPPARAFSKINTYC